MLLQTVGRFLAISHMGHKAEIVAEIFPTSMDARSSEQQRWRSSNPSSLRRNQKAGVGEGTSRHPSGRNPIKVPPDINSQSPLQAVAWRDETRWRPPSTVRGKESQKRVDGVVTNEAKGRQDGSAGKRACCPA